MFKKKSNELLLLLLQRNQLSVFRSSANTITNLAFPPAIVQDLEVKDEAQFITVLKAFVGEQKIAQGEVVIVLDKSVYFSQAITETEKAATTPRQTEVKTNEDENKSKRELEKSSQTSASDVDEQRMLFVQSMPFTNVFSTVVTNAKDKIIIALNRELYEPIVKVLNEAQLKVTHIYPMVVVADIFAQGLTSASALHLLENREKFKVHNFLQSAKKDDEIITTVMPTETSDKKRVLLLVIVFVLLLGALGGLLWWTNKNAPPPKQQVTVVQPVSEETVPATSADPVISNESTSNIEELLTSSQSANLAIQIIDASGQPTTAATLQSQLRELGFTTVSVGEQVALLQGPTKISVRPEVPVNLKEALLSQFERWQYVVTFEESADQSPPIIITVTEQ